MSDLNASLSAMCAAERAAFEAARRYASGTAEERKSGAKTLLADLPYDAVKRMSQPSRLAASSARHEPASRCLRNEMREGRDARLDAAPKNARGFLRSRSAARRRACVVWLIRSERPR